MDEDRVQLVYFKIHGETFAFHMEYLVEIVQTMQADITPFFAPIPMIRGRWDYRGASLYVIDLHDFFGLDERAEGQRDNFDTQQHELPKSMLVIRIREQVFGLLSDTVLQVVPLRDFYEYPEMISTLPKRYVAGITRIDSQLVLLLDIQELINEYELEALRNYTDSNDNLDNLAKVAPTE
jgi:chemotaxis signal transduction protein